jgi:hypothetical protein
MTDDNLLVVLGAVALLSIGAYSALRLRSPALRLARRMSRQKWPSRPLPEVTQSDLERIVSRDFHAGELPEVIAILSEFDNEWESLEFVSGSLRSSWLTGT